MKKVLMTILLLFVFLKFSYSLDTNIVKYFPLTVGNKWVYRVTRFLPIPATWNEVMKITKDTTIEGKRYFLFSGCEAFGYYVRLDTVTGNVLRFENITTCPRRPRESFLDSLTSRLFDTVYHCAVNPYEARLCRDTLYFTLSGVNYSAKRMRDVHEIYGTERRYAINLGLVEAVIGDPYSINYILKGCVLNGILYGDTTLLNINNISLKIPNGFSLSQNYPNPFNPVTKIRFSLPLPSKGGAMDVKLIVYDVLGREVANLIPPLWGGKVGLSPGTYEVEWSACSYPSGVYFYKLITTNFTETRKMVLVK